MTWKATRAQIGGPSSNASAHIASRFKLSCAARYRNPCFLSPGYHRHDLLVPTRSSSGAWDELDGRLLLPPHRRVKTPQGKARQRKTGRKQRAKSHASATLPQLVFPGPRARSRTTSPIKELGSQP